MVVVQVKNRESAAKSRAKRAEQLAALERQASALLGWDFGSCGFISGRRGRRGGMDGWSR